MPGKPKTRKCPYKRCGTTRYKSLREGKYCRACGGRIWTALGDWVDDDTHTSIMRIVLRFENYLAAKLDDPEFEFTGSTLRQEKNLAAQLLHKCGWNFDIASRVMFLKLRQNIKTVETLSWVIGYGFDKNLSKAKSDIKKEQDRAMEEQTVASIYQDRRDLFDGRQMDSTGRPINRGSGKQD